MGEHLENDLRGKGRGRRLIAQHVEQQVLVRLQGGAFDREIARDSSSSSHQIEISAGVPRLKSNPRTSPWIASISKNGIAIFPPFSFRIERAFAAPLPERERGVRIVAPHLGGQFQQCAIDRRTIVISEFDQAGFMDEAAQLDQVARAFPALHDPGARIVTTPCRFQALDQRPVAHSRYRRCRQ